MDGWSVPRNGSVLDCGETDVSCETDGVSVDIGNTNSVKGTDKLQVLFDQVLLIFMKEITGNECVRPIPPMLGDGRSVNLLKLFWVVRQKGGYEWVSDNGLWGLVAEECGLDVGIKACLKLIYFKYLHQLGQWLLGILQNGSLDRGDGECDGKLDSLLQGLGTEFRGLILRGMGPKEGDDGVLELESEKTDRSILNPSIVPCSAENGPNDGEDQNCGDDVVNQDPLIVKKSPFSRKRKRNSFSRMLHWVKEIAKYPEEGGKGNKNRSEVFSTQVLGLRKSLLIRRKVCTKDEQSLLQVKVILFQLSIVFLPLKWEVPVIFKLFGFTYVPIFCS